MRHYWIKNAQDGTRSSGSRTSKRKRSAESDAEDSDAKPASKRSPRSWGPVLSLETLELDKAVSALLQSCTNTLNTFTSTFFHDDALKRQNCKSQLDPADALMANYIYAGALSRRAKPDSIRLAYTMLGFYDFGKRLWPNNISGCIGKRIMHQFRAEFADFIACPEVPLEDLCENISGWSLCGRRLHLICAEFGDGSIFFLHDIVSPDFLRDKCPMTGQYQATAFKHLHKLGLKEKSEFVGANVVGAQIRRFFSKPFDGLASISSDQD
ncbi:hypothetical protein KCU95_g5809, partial [Aureobasidium melanogenum]